MDLERVRHELALAEQYRSEGNPGKSRVCARRAAGWAIRPLFQREEGAKPPSNVVALLRWFSESSLETQELRLAARRLTVAVTTEHALPHLQDPLEDARRIVEAMSTAATTPGYDKGSDEGKEPKDA